MLDNASLVVLLIPVIAGLVGWFTNWLAVRMTLYPVEFRGIGRVGWQGVVPANVESLSKNFSRLIDEELLNLEDILGGIDNNDEDIERVVARVSTNARCTSFQLKSRRTNGSGPGRNCGSISVN